MVKSFKFFVGNEEEDDYLIEALAIEHLDDDSPSWSWTSIMPFHGHTYDIVETQSNGIHEFLNRFPNRFRVPVISIIGPNGRFHDSNTEYEDGWGFDITSDLLTIRFLRFEP